MQKVKLLKDNKLGSKDDVIVVGNNIAHGLIDSGKAKLFRASNKMMTTKRKKKKKGYKTKWQ